MGDGAVLPILHLNGYKISNPTIFGRMTHEEMESFFRGCSWKPYFVEGDDPMTMHEKMAETLDTVIEEIHDIQKRARAGEDMGHIQWPMIVLRTPKGWTGPKVVDGKPIEGTFRAHQVPIDITVGTPNQEEHLKQIEEWLHSYHAGGTVRRERHPDPRTAGTGSHRRPPSGCQPARKRRQAAA